MSFGDHFQDFVRKCTNIRLVYSKLMSGSFQSLYNQLAPTAIEENRKFSLTFDNYCGSFGLAHKELIELARNYACWLVRH